ncbi:MAG: leucyl aminopeptidase [Beutenbergiaceae bacterium]
MTTVELTSAPLTKLRSDAIVLATTPLDGGGVAVIGLNSVPKALRSPISNAAQALRLTGDLDEVVKVPAPAGLQAPVLVFTGTGHRDAGLPDEETWRRSAGSATRQLAGFARVALAFGPVPTSTLAAIAEGALLGAYTFSGYRSDTTPVDLVQVVADTSKSARAAIDQAAIVAEAVHGVRDLVNTAPNDLYPATFVDRAKALAKPTKVSVTVLEESALRAGGYGGLLGVGQGSVRGPRLVRLEYRPRRARAHYALVGKGITFDSGGLSIKPAKSMETMKCDMAGAAAVLHTVVAAARLGLGVRVTGWLALAENMPSGTAQRPSDVLTIRGGRTVEVLNTDAEGRLVLADALVAAGEENPDVIVDIATLTGAQMIALGNQVSAAMGTEAVREAVVSAAQAAGEQFWPMPLPDELRASMKTPVADIANMGERYGGMLVAGLFLQEFTDGRPWAHLDIAGPAYNDTAARHYVPKGGTGVGVRTLLQLLHQAGEQG